MTTITTMEDQLRAFNQQKADAYIPTAVFVVVVCCLGILGNSVALSFYARKQKKTTSSFLLKVLSGHDLISSFVHLSFIYVGMNSITYTSDALCKVPLVYW